MTWTEFMLDMLFPARCPVCDGIVNRKRELCHMGCLRKLHLIEGPVCLRCGKQVQEDVMEYCFDCTKKEHFFDRGFSIWSYDDVMRQSISRFKYHGKKEYADFYVSELEKYFYEKVKDRIHVDIDALIPVPIHMKKQKVRGYNQAEVMAKGLGNKLGIRVLENYLVRCVNTTPQKELNHVERKRNLMNAFALNENFQKSNKTIKNAIIIDDIYTTGSTVDVCSNLLKKSGIETVYVLTLCIGSGK